MAFIALFALLVLPVSAVNVVDQGTANPIRRVVTMLQNMQAKVATEAEKEKVLYDKFMCYCKTSGGALSESIAAAEAAAPALVSEIEQASAKKVQMEADLKAAKASRAEAKAAMGKATAIREKEAATFAKESSDYKTNIAALKGAITSISSGMSGSLLQTKTLAILRKLAIDGPINNDMDRQNLLAFLSTGHSSDYAPASGEIVGILKQLKDEMSASLADITADEKSAVASYEGLILAKTKEVATLQTQIERNSALIGSLAMEIEMKKNDLDETSAALLKDKAFLSDLDANCATKKSEWAEIEEMRATEQVALAETIKVLNEDDTLELFKKTLPGASSLLQLKLTSGTQLKQALAKIQDAKRHTLSHRPELDFIALAIEGKKVDFGKVITMIDSMIKLLGEEQQDDDHKKEYCEAQFDASEDKTKALERSISGLETEIADLEESIATMASEIKALIAGIESLDKSVAEATEQRQEEHEEYVELMASDSAAKELLDFAKNRLNKFYNPTLYKAPPTTTLSMEDKLYVEGGGVLPTTPPPGGIAGTGVEVAASFVQISAHSFGKVAPPPPPETMAAYSKKSSESTGVIAMIDMLIKDLSTEMTEAKVTEENSQKEYVALMADSKEKRADDSKTLSDKTAAKATAEADLTAATADKDSTTKELMATEKYIASLHSECDWLMKYYSVRAEARAGEVESLKKAKDVLSGADYSLVQVRSKSRNLRGVQ
mmetsp:Transcript_158222/g.274806  ORF Transcript_158222/g.274806 Transcript_158222/m.274806 type:complete len:723 (-) Transcript_158222:37-2205(-)